MKVFISADIEGTAATSRWLETSSKQPEYPFYAREMTEEVVAACEGAIAAGADEILIKDAHGSATNLDLSLLPEQASVIRGWEGHPYMMVQGIDRSFDAALFVGYHSEAGSPGNPMSHTMTLAPQHVRINGVAASEFMIYSFCAAYEGVPTVFLSGDKALCSSGLQLYPWLSTVAVKEGCGLSSINMAPKKACRLIRENVQAALSRDLRALRFELPGHFSVDIEYKEHDKARTNSYFPGVIQTDPHTLHFDETDYFETARKLKFLL